VTHGTETSRFLLPTLSGGAYVSDPLHLIKETAIESAPLIIGGDTGGKTTKIGFTYTNKNKKKQLQEYQALLISTEDDSYESLSHLSLPHSTPFTHSSSQYTHIFSLFQHLIDTQTLQQPIYLSCDWPCMNAILGLKAPACNHPCPICDVKKKTSSPLLIPAHSTLLSRLSL
jgi:hypothetical protein